MKSYQVIRLKSFYGLRRVSPLLILLSLMLTPRPATAQPSEAGWGPWRPLSELGTAQIDAGFSNMELGGYMDYEAACQEAAAAEQAEIRYEFRLSDLVSQIGTGQMESRCVINRQARYTFTQTAVDATVEYPICLKVKANTGGGVSLRQDAAVDSARLAVLANGTVVRPESSPALLITDPTGREWMRVMAPRQGWVSLRARVGAPLNLVRCRH